MSSSNTTYPCTKGDLLVNTITTLGEMRHVAVRLNKTINHLNKFVKDTLNDDINRRLILIQIRLIDRVSIYMSDKLVYITGQQQFKYINDQAGSRKHVATNTESKI